MTVSIDPRMISVRDVERAGGHRRELARASTRGTLHRLRPGVYVATDTWRTLDEAEKYLAVCRAASTTVGARPVLSHWSAAVVHGIPILGSWPTDIHRLMERTSGGRSRPGTVAHPTRLDTAEIVEVNGLLVTTVARTTADLAACASFGSAVASADYVLHRKRKRHLTREHMLNAIEVACVTRGRRRAHAILEFATDLADSPAESVSRVSMHLAGLVMPELQSEFFDADGFIGATDFHWPGVRLVGEVDGRQKYLKPEYLEGRSPGEVVYLEKLREDRLRNIDLSVRRWDWQRANSPTRLAALLRPAGVPLRRGA
ncbi:hypothetical protein B7R21_16555 [Subtercola boreus]|uniref:AbiEi antitoxin N-terminal domain-containing protein n=1 Tax=Subtercola boreus TaxID=120213 RepID=A0A3E0VBR5_9MICO|nr:type IV toxin-antitoxin system AbiEi family antitoxin domain-containing protein [Subtercola boreus]RFA07201.1 hypothetical protein B7R21_16555 [Subtercola boreus]